MAKGCGHMATTKEKYACLVKRNRSRHTSMVAGVSGAVLRENSGGTRKKRNKRFPGTGGHRKKKRTYILCATRVVEQQK